MAVENDKIVYGGNLMLFVGSGVTKKPLAFSQNAKLGVNMKTREISSKDSSGSWTDKAAGKYDWNASTDGLLAFTLSGATSGMDEIYNLFVAGLPINMVFAQKTGTTPFFTIDATKKNFTGTALITSIEMSAPETESATYSINLEGTGSLVMA